MTTPQSPGLRPEHGLQGTSSTPAQPSAPPGRPPACQVPLAQPLPQPVPQPSTRRPPKGQLPAQVLQPCRPTARYHFTPSEALWCLHLGGQPLHAVLHHPTACTAAWSAGRCLPVSAARHGLQLTVKQSPLRLQACLTPLRPQTCIPAVRCTRAQATQSVHGRKADQVRAWLSSCCPWSAQHRPGVTGQQCACSEGDDWGWSSKMLIASPSARHLLILVRWGQA